MPNTFYWYNGDKKNPPGVYACLSPGFCVRVPFPDIIDATNSYNRTGSIRCKHDTQHECLKIRRDLASRYNSDVRECTFAHKNDKYIKIGTLFRCPNMPHFGTHRTLSKDLDSILDEDIKTMLMYSLSDMLLSSLWYQKKHPSKKTSLVLTDIDVC